MRKSILYITSYGKQSLAPAVSTAGFLLYVVFVFVSRSVKTYEIIAATLKTAIEKLNFAAVSRIMFKQLLVFAFLLFAVSLQAQNFTLFGKVTNTRLEPLSLVSVQIKSTSTGTVTKNDGSYALRVSEGMNELVITMVGYKTQVLPIAIKGNYEQNIILEEEAQDLGEVVIRTKAKDRAEEVMRNLIRNKENILAASGAYSANLYIKAVLEDSGYAEKKKRTEKEKPDETQKMTMAEISLKLDYESDQRIKEERLGVRKTGESKNLYYLSATEGQFNFYNNLVKVPSISPTPFVSPVSYSGLLAYRFKTLKIQRFGKHKIYTISVKPRQMSNATVEGEITVSDSAWAILHTRFSFPKYHLQEYEAFEVEQQYEFVNNAAWMITRQQFSYQTKGNKSKLTGQTVVTYTNYELNKNLIGGILAQS